MFLLGVGSDEKVLWGVALGIGLVVIVVVIALLTFLSQLVRDIDAGVDSLWTVTSRMAQNTTGLYQLAGTGSVLRALREELIRHDKLLGEKR
jgi:UDP-N-acetyl-D-mannosaminuronic acid transferase (WecB/TagA/CpsF family)